MVNDASGLPQNLTQFPRTRRPCAAIGPLIGTNLTPVGNCESERSFSFTAAQYPDADGQPPAPDRSARRHSGRRRAVLFAVRLPSDVDERHLPGRGHEPGQPLPLLPVQGSDHRRHHRAPSRAGGGRFRRDRERAFVLRRPRRDGADVHGRAQRRGGESRHGDHGRVPPQSCHRQAVSRFRGRRQSAPGAGFCRPRRSAAKSIRRPISKAPPPC